MRLALVALALAALAAAAASAPACDGGTYVYIGYVYEPSRDCVEDGQSAVDVIAGSPPGDCQPVCILQALSDGGREVFVSKECGPYPAQADVSGKDPVCVKALAAQARGASCSDASAPLGSASAPQDAGAD